MAGEIFISYRRADEAWARLLHRALKSEGIEAWYDALIGPGQEWRLTTAKALENSQIFVLLFSENAAQSSDIAKELAAATHEKKLVIPVRLQNIEPKGSFLYELASRNWVNAYDDTEARLAELAKGLAQLVRNGGRDESVLPFERGSSPSPSRNSMRRPVLMAAAAIVIAALVALFWMYPRSATMIASFQPPSNPAGVSLAVLPFVNLSGDPKQEFFSDGMTEEITSALAKVPGVAVIGRTSAFQFKGENKDMRAIGEALGAKNLIEGSVRKAGDQVRITVQLIKAADGTHVWTESYDRKLTDIFAVQEDIATAIASALQVPLGLKQGENLVSNRTVDISSYQDYLRAVALFRARNTPELIKVLQGVVARNPGYAPAWALLAQAHQIPADYAQFEDDLAAGSFDKARTFLRSQLGDMEKAAQEAIRLDSKNAAAYTALGTRESLQGNWAAAEDYGKRALALDPNNPDILYSRGYLLAATGNVKGALEIQKKIMALEPFVPVYRNRGADLLWALGQVDGALDIEKTLQPDSRFNVVLAKIYATKGQFANAADALLAMADAPTHPRKAWEEAARLIRLAPSKVAAPETLPLLPGNLSFVYLFIGADGRSLDFVEREISVGYFGGIFRDLWAPASAALRKTERFKAFVRKARLVEYWQARGWPDLCHPVGADDFACN